MTDERYKQLMIQMGMPESHSLLCCLRQAVMETEMECLKKTDALQAKIDELMLEYCPNEMTPDQLSTYEANQKGTEFCTLIIGDTKMSANKCHPHKDLIIEWAYGAKIQYKMPTGKWVDSTCDTITWSVNKEYRIKPEPIILQYRKYLTVYNDYMDKRTEYGIAIAIDPSYNVEKESHFVKWLDDDWIVVEITP